jgi:hypothetical protein
MAGFGTTEKAIINAAKFAPLWGKLYQWIFCGIRLMICLKLHKVFKDTEKHLECDVETIGCARMCHNMFYPMAQDRYWQLQVFCVALPSIIFIAYKSKVDLHINKALEVKKQREKEHFEELKAEAEAEGTTVHEYCKEYGKQAPKNRSKIEEIEENFHVKNTKFSKLQTHIPPKLFLAYYFHIWARILIDVCFVVYQFRIYLYKFVMPEAFSCYEYPCKGGAEKDHPVTCWISTPIQRTVYLQLHFAFNVITILVACFELYTIGLKPLAKAWYRRSEDWTKEYLDHEKPMFFSRDDYNDGFFDSRGVASSKHRALVRQQSRGGYLQTSGVTYKRSQSTRPKSMLYRSTSIMQH